MPGRTLTLIPTPEDFQILDFFIAGDGVIAPEDLRNVQLPSDLDYTRGVVINGKGPVWLFAHLVHLCHPTAWIATADPRLGAVVVENHVPAGPTVGSVIAPERIKPYLPTHVVDKDGKPAPTPPPSRVIAFVGPPHSGKSVLMNAVRLEIRKRNSALFQRDFFIIRACPDGEGDWFSDIPTDQAMTFRYKGSFTDEFVNKVCAQLEGVKKHKSLIIVDCGGRIDRKNQQVLNRCTHAIIVSRDETAFAEWRGALTASEVQVLAEVESSLVKEAVCLSTSPLRLRIGPLVREQRGEVLLPDPLVDGILSLLQRERQTVS